MNISHHGASLIERLAQLENPRNVEDWETRDGYYLSASRVSREDVASLIDLALKWTEWDWCGADEFPAIDWERIELLPVTAWRTLADLKATEAVEPLIRLLCEMEVGEDWLPDELPIVFGKIGPSAIEPLSDVATDQDACSTIRSTAVRSLQKIAEHHPATRDQVVQILAKMMANTEQDIDWNTTVMMVLVELDGVEAAEAIERAFSENRIDVGMIGDWEDVRLRLGVESLGLKMPEDPYNSIEDLRRSMGIGWFSDKPIFVWDEVDETAALNYYQRCRHVFSRSPEAEEVVSRHGELGWHDLLLEFGIEYRGEIVDAMSLETIRNFVLGFLPENVTTPPDSAAEIVDELTMFWRFLERVYDHPQAETILEWLREDKLIGQLEAALADPDNYGMTKTLTMMATEAGYDVTSEADLGAFLSAYSSSQASAPPASLQLDSAPPQAAPLSPDARQARRNSRCPCGSGKKYKKCCGRRR